MQIWSHAQRQAIPFSWRRWGGAPKIRRIAVHGESVFITACCAAAGALITAGPLAVRVRKSRKILSKKRVRKRVGWDFVPQNLAMAMAQGSAARARVRRLFSSVIAAILVVFAASDVAVDSDVVSDGVLSTETASKGDDLEMDQIIHVESDSLLGETLGAELDCSLLACLLLIVNLVSLSR